MSSSKGTSGTLHEKGIMYNQPVIPHINMVRALKTCMQDTFARATHSAKRARDDRVSCIQLKNMNNRNHLLMKETSCVNDTAMLQKM